MTGSSGGGGGAGMDAASSINCLIDWFCFLADSLNSGLPVMYARGPRRMSTGSTGFALLVTFGGGTRTHPSSETLIGILLVFAAVGFVLKPLFKSIMFFFERQLAKLKHETEG